MIDKNDFVPANDQIAYLSNHILTIIGVSSQILFVLCIIVLPIIVGIKYVRANEEEKIKIKKRIPIYICIVIILFLIVNSSARISMDV